MDNMNQIGLDKAKSKQIADKLNDLLANYSIFFQNVKGHHWNIKGDRFFELHKKFDKLYNDLLEKADTIAERILALGHVPEHNFSQYLDRSRIKESANPSDRIRTVENIIDSLQELIGMQRDIHFVAADSKDEGTNDLMITYIREQEKLVWMFDSFLKKTEEPEMVQYDD